MNREYNTLIITNGDAAIDAIKNAGIKADFIPWRDVLHEGPVLNQTDKELAITRARFLSSLGWGSFYEILHDFNDRNQHFSTAHYYKEIILWFEHDLYDQLQLIEILSRVYKNKTLKSKLFLICTNEYVGESTPEQLNYQFTNREKISTLQKKTGAIAWQAFTAVDPNKLFRFCKKDYPELPFLLPALNRHLEEFPSKTTGLSRTQETILTLLQKENKTLVKLFTDYLDYEEPKYVGDRTFIQYLIELANFTKPLVTPVNKQAVVFSIDDDEYRKLFNSEFQITETGRKVLQGKINNISINGLNRWLGGTYLTTHNFWERDKDLIFSKQTNKYEDA